MTQTLRKLSRNEIVAAILLILLTTLITYGLAFRDSDFAAMTGM
jgi:hypothetical protein